MRNDKTVLSQWHSPIQADVFCVTVTYGDRRHLLTQVLDSLPAQGVCKVVVVDNGARWPVRADLDETYSDFVDVVEMGRNTGSAPGYAAGIQRAMDLGAEFLFLLDDDNRPSDNMLSVLLDAYAHAEQVTPKNSLAVVAFRPDHQSDVAAGVAAHRINPRANSFHGFHVTDIGYKIWRRTTWGKPKVEGSLPATVIMEQAPYSGLLFHRDLVLDIGLPNANFVLYGDDNEWTYRIKNKGGSIVLVTAAMLEDLESSWNIKARFSNGFTGILKGEGDFRAYYGMRNGAYFDAMFMKKNRFVFWLNRIVYMTLLFLFSIVPGERERYRLLREAAKDGLSGRLGMHDRFPL